MNVNAQAGQTASPFRSTKPPRPADGRGRHRRDASPPPSTMCSTSPAAIAPFLRHMDATGVTRYLPVLVYPKGSRRRRPISVTAWKNSRSRSTRSGSPETQTNTRGLGRRHAEGGRHIRKAGMKPKRIAAEFGFLPYDAAKVLRAAFPDADWVDALYVLERQRVEEIAGGIEMLKYASEAVIEFDAGGDRGERARHAPRPRWSRRCGAKRPTAASPSNIA